MKLCVAQEQRNIVSVTIHALRCSYIFNIFFIFLAKYGSKIHCIVARLYLGEISVDFVMFQLF